MLDIKLIREQPDVIRKVLQDRRSTFPIEPLLARDRERRELIAELEAQRKEHKQRSDDFAARREAAGVSQQALREMSDAIKGREKRLREIEAELDKELAFLPNIPHASVPVGDATANQIVRTHGAKTSFGFTPLTHLELGDRLGLFDLERAAKLAGSHFPLFTHQGARLERALIHSMLDVQTQEGGYTEIAPPYLVNRAAMFSTGQQIGR